MKQNHSNQFWRRPLRLNAETKLLELILLELKKVWKSHFALKQSYWNLFCRNWALKVFLWLQYESSKFSFIENEYMNIWYITISLRHSFGAPTSFKKHFALKQIQNRAFRGFFFFFSEVTLANIFFSNTKTYPAFIGT